MIVASDGALSGIPHDPDTGLNEFTIRATGPNEDYAEATLQINVVNRFMGENGLVDFAGIAANWLTSNCGICNGADLDDDNDVGPADLNILAENWLAY